VKPSFVLFLVVAVACGGGSNKPSDAGADAPALPKCSDGIDNDGDGKIDYPNDPGCVVPQQDDETDDCPSGPGCPQCSNGKDDDANGATDFPDDPGCTSAGDFDEYTQNPVACGTNIMIHQLPATGMVSGMLETTQVFSQVSPCGGGDANGIVVSAYELHLTEAKVIVASTTGSATDTVLDIRGADCKDATSELACNDNAANGVFSSITYAAQPGTYYILVESKTNAAGAFTLQVQQFAGEGAACTDQSECGPGLVCRVPHGGSTMSCEKPVCSDGRDDDGDGKIDYPADPGCEGPNDTDETDDCPSGPGCPQCANGSDDDGDGQTDYPADTSCASASGASEASCPNDMDNLGTIAGPTTMGDLTTAHDDFTLACSSNTGNDASFILQLPVAVTSLTAGTEGSTITDTVVQIWSGPCASSIACDDDGGTGNLSLATATNLAAGTYAITVAGYGTTHNGPFTLNVHGTIAEGNSCERDLGGALVCEAGTTCGGTMGARTCQPVACRDGIDDDGDGKADYPNDPGCTSPNDADETDDCPSGANCPACSNGVDDDGDGTIDYPADLSCASASGASEASCPIETDPLTNLTMPTMSGTLAGLQHNLTLACQSTTGNDTVFTLKLDVPVASITFDTDGSTATDTVVQVDDDNCTTSLGCDDDSSPSGNLSLLTLANLAPGSYSVIVAGYGTTNDTGFTLNTHGTIAGGNSCESPLVTSGVLACASGFVCGGTIGSRTCMPAGCSDGVDNDGDGKADYPDDPGCTNLSDADETDPATPPVCANGSDDDGDGTTDYPADLGCEAASGTSEVFCAVETDPVVAITAPTTNIDLATATHGLTLACQSNTGNDVTLGFRLPVRVATLTIDTEGSTSTDTVVQVSNSLCSTSLACDDDGGSGNLSLVTMANVAPGAYAVTVAGYSTTHNQAAKVNVHGTLGAGTRCDSSLFTAGVLTCASGLSCSGTPATCH
jgi:hypothetical protein